MSIRHRAMRPKDVRECVEMVAAHPIVAPRYGDSLADLRPAWLRLFSSDGFCSAVVFEDFEEGAGRARSRMLGFGVSVFVSDDFLRELKTTSSLWIGPELARRVKHGDSPLLSEKEVREANSRGGLNLVVWHACVRMEHVERVELWREFVGVFLENHRGYLLKELVANGESVQHLLGLRNTGGRLLNRANGNYEDFEEKSLQGLLEEAHIVGLTREMAQRQHGSWIGSLFLYEAPRFGFSASEQRLLLSALAGGTDEELSRELGVSLSTIKKTWRSIYRRVGRCDPELIPSSSREDGKIFKRGRNKKQRLMVYLREHLQELRPVSRKLLRAGIA